QSNQTELTGYAGLLPLLLAAVGLFISKQKSVSIFWLSAAFLAWLLTLGNATPVARFVYHLPILNTFRVPARHFMEFTFSISVLCGLGVAAVIKQRISLRFLTRVILFGVLGMLAALTLLLLNSSRIAGVAAQNGVAGVSLRPWTNRAVGVPLII